jgi:hypothetical protein
MNPDVCSEQEGEDVTWYTDTTERLRTRKLDPRDITTLVSSDLGHRRIEVAEAYWRSVVAQAFAITNAVGMDWATVVRNISKMVEADESLLLPSLLRDYVYNKMADEIDPQFRVTADLQIRMESVQTSLLWAWGYGKGVYDIDADVAASVLESDLDSVSDMVLQHMPYRSLFINYKVNDCIGAFFHRAVLPRTGQVGLTFLLLKAGWPNRKPEEPDFTAGMIDLGADDLTIDTLISKQSAQVSDPDTFRKYMNLLLLLCCKNVDIVGRVTQTPGPSQDCKTRTAIMTTTPRHWDVGVRQGAALRAANAAVAASESGTHAGPRAHVRRAHWHTFLTGPRDAETRPTVVHWIAPILVGAAEDIVETHHRVGG